jgi:hypothetical protein
MYREKSRPTMCTASVVFIKLPEVSNCPMGENTPNLVALVDADDK